MLSSMPLPQLVADLKLRASTSEIDKATCRELASSLRKLARELDSLGAPGERVSEQKLQMVKDSLDKTWISGGLIVERRIRALLSDFEVTHPDDQEVVRRYAAKLVNKEGERVLPATLERAMDSVRKSMGVDMLDEQKATVAAIEKYRLTNREDRHVVRSFAYKIRGLLNPDESD